ncbi:response regulator [Bacteroidota bacterium]
MDNPIPEILDTPSGNIFHQIFASLNIPCAIADSNRIIRWLNDDAHKLFTQSPIGSDLVSYFDISEPIIEKQKSFSLNKPIVNLSITPLQDSKIIKGYFLLFSNDSASSASAHNLAHDLNNIFTSILNSIELLKQKNKSENKQTSLLNNIENSSIRAAEIIEEVLSKKDKSNSFNKRKVNISSLITEVINNVKSTLGDNISISEKIQPDLKTILGKSNDLFRVIMNLIVNAKESIEDKGNIFIEAGNLEAESKVKIAPDLPGDDYIYISIKDTGKGISKENLSKIFLAEFSTKKTRRKAGLGLNIVKEIVEKHSGAIYVNSVIKKGTEFTMVFPATTTRKLPPKTKEKKTILIAEDEFTLRELLVELLESFNYNVVSAADGNELLGKYPTYDGIDLLIIDRKMPGMSGIECIQKIRDDNKEIPIILASGSPTEKLDKIVSELNINRIVNKPYDFEYLLSNIEELIL